MKTWYLIAYDVRDPKRLRHVSKKLEAYGSRIQYSIFRCRVDAETLAKLRWELSEILDTIDSLLVIPICTKCAGKVPVHSTPDQHGWADDPPTFQIL
ncbi:CRISPR-associated endonuclease Cas2 [Thalassoglobus polymorphus]|uniref:CRISPR-associated endoribonuclease Cas2 n=1 Tax=Thalassoglobus polymorphus TaxID=2527994 RepID=A0A517QKZ9_9PLAN|nr:CRISPR-associated endonuclease Cas2 [Thalassoglobus polymorphus]QDT32303.1 CRISPR-associated endoribonuclease Cas2 [Thalassoglobus polymorphus]